MSNRSYRPVDMRSNYHRNSNTPQNMQKQFDFGFGDQKMRNQGKNDMMKNQKSGYMFEKDKIGSLPGQNMYQQQMQQMQQQQFALMQQQQFAQQQQQLKELKKQNQISLQHIQQMPHSDYTSKKSLQAFVSEFQQTTSFNETDLTQLGIDVNSTQPLLPNLQSVMSAIPLGMKSSYQAPQWYKSIPQEPDIKQRISLFGTQTLFFIFYGCGKKESRLAALELQRRGYTYNSETNEWSSPNGSVWDMSQWKLDDGLH